MAQVVVVPESLRSPSRVGRDLGDKVVRSWYSAAQWKALEKGDISAVHSDKPGERNTLNRRVNAAAIIAFPPELVWQALADFERRPEFMPGAKEIRVVKIDGNRIWLDERVKVLLMSIRYRVINTLEPQIGAMSWVIDKSAPHDIVDTEGAWRVTGINDSIHTLVTYRARVATGQPVPGFLENLIVKHSLPDLIGGLRTEVERRAHLEGKAKATT